MGPILAITMATSPFVKAAAAAALGMFPEAAAPAAAQV